MNKDKPSVKQAEVHHICGTKIYIPYTFQVDIFLNPSYCHKCLQKFFPYSATFLNDKRSDGSIEEYEEHLASRETVIPIPVRKDLTRLNEAIIKIEKEISNDTQV